LGKKILGNFSLYMALHLIPSPHLGKNFPKFFISVVDTGNKFTTRVLDTGDKFIAGFNNKGKNPCM